MRHFSLALAALAGSVAAFPAAAIELIELDDIIISAGQEPRAAGRTGATVTTASAADVQATGELGLTEFLARMPGVGILARGGLGGQTGFTLRGVSQNYVKVLVDGIDVSDPSGPQVAFDMGRLTSLNFGRAELLRGSQSAVHGGQAVAGVLSFESPTLDAPGTRQVLMAEAGSFGTAAASYEYAHRSATGSLAFTLSHIRTDGFSAAAAGSEADGFAATRASLKGETTLDSGVTLGFAAFAEHAKGEWDPQYYADPTRSYDVSLGDGESFDEVSRQASAGLRAYALFDAGTVEHELSVTLYDMQRNLFGTETYLDYDAFWNVSGSTLRTFDVAYSGRRSALAWKGATDVGQGGRLVFGADLTRESYAQTGDTGYGPVDLGANSQVAGVFAEYAQRFGEGLDVVASLRHDEHSRFGGQNTARLAASWRLADDLILRGAVGTGFRAPSGYELYGPYGFAGLQPEQSRSFDLGLEKQLGADAFLRATLFRIETDNLIDFSDMGTPWDYADDRYAQVPGRTIRQGLELEGAVPLGERFDLTAAYTFTDATTPPLSFGNTWSAGFGRHQLALAVEARLAEGLRLNMAARMVADRPTLPNYSVLSATLHYDVAPGTEAYLRIENLADTQYQTVAGYGTGGRAFYVGLRKSF
ncbi:MAG: TonB-dependent receptor [Rhodobacteraceae bacterium]|nr:TonB-dependent receptor [Paracoccaceae bacterium]